MKVLILPSWYPNNAQDSNGVFFRDQAIALAHAGHDVSLLAIKLRSVRTLFNVNSEKYKSYENDEGVKTYRKQVWAAFPRIPYGNYFLMKSATTRLFKQFVSQYGLPDIIHAHALVYAGVIASELGKKYNIPVVLTEHSTGFARGIYRARELRQASAAVRHVAYRIAVSEPFSELLEQKLGEKWTYLPNIVADRFSTTVLRKNKPKSTNHVLLNLALMTAKKGQKYLLQATLLLKNRGIRVELWLAGDGPIRAELEEHTAELGLSNQVKFLGMINPSDVPDLMKKTDLLVVSSDYETFGVVAAEALMLGKPVVATKCGGPESIVKEGDGLLVAPRDPCALADGMQKVLEHLTDYDPMQISWRAHERFGARSVAAQLTEIYSKALAGRARLV